MRMRPHYLVGAGAPSLLFPSAQIRPVPKGTERRRASISKSRLAAWRLWRKPHAPRRSIAALRSGFLRPQHRPQVRASWDAALDAVSGLQPVPVQRTLRRAVLMPPGRFPGPPELLLARQDRGRRIRSRSHERLMRAPFDGQDNWHIVLSRNVVKSHDLPLVIAGLVPVISLR